MTEWPEARLRPSRAGQGKAQALGPTWTQWSHLPLGEFPRASRAEASWVEGPGGWADSAGQGGLGLVRADRDRAPSVRSVQDAGPAQAQLGMWGVGGRCSGDSSWVILMTPVSRAPSPQSIPVLSPWTGPSRWGLATPLSPSQQAHQGQESSRAPSTISQMGKPRPREGTGLPGPHGQPTASPTAWTSSPMAPEALLSRPVGGTALWAAVGRQT